MFFYIVLTPISTTSGLRSTINTRKNHQIDVYIYQCDWFTLQTDDYDLIIDLCRFNVKVQWALRWPDKDSCSEIESIYQVW